VAATSLSKKASACIIRLKNASDHRRFLRELSD